MFTLKLRNSRILIPNLSYCKPTDIKLATETHATVLQKSRFDYSYCEVLFVAQARIFGFYRIVVHLEDTYFIYELWSPIRCTNPKNSLVNPLNRFQPWNVFPRCWFKSLIFPNTNTILFNFLKIFYSSPRLPYRCVSQLCDISNAIFHAEKS